MNKTSNLLIIVFLIFSSCASLNGVKKNTSNLTGTWKYIESSFSENTSNEAVDIFMKDTKIIFNEDKTFEISVSTFSKKGTWTLGKGGKNLILGFENTQNDERLKTFEISFSSDNNLILTHSNDEEKISVKFSKE